SNALAGAELETARPGRTWGIFRDAHINTNVSVSQNGLVILGDMTVDGNVAIGEQGFLLVGGNVKVTQLDSEGEVTIGGDLHASVVHVRYNDYSLDVHDTLRASVLIQNDHHVRAGVLSVDHHACLPRPNAYAAALVPEVLRDGHPDLRAIARVLRLGRS